MKYLKKLNLSDEVLLTKEQKEIKKEYEKGKDYYNNLKENHLNNR